MARLKTTVSPNINMPSVNNNETNQAPVYAKNYRFIVKTALTINYGFILFCLMNTPVSIMSIIYWKCDHVQNHCDIYITFFKLWIFPRIFTLFSAFVVIVKKIECTNVA